MNIEIMEGGHMLYQEKAAIATGSTSFSIELSPRPIEQKAFNAEVELLAHQISELVHSWGFKRIHGRIWTHLYLARHPFDAADLVRQLDISKALVSISLREMLEYEVIIDLGKGDRGTHLYRINPDLQSVFKCVLRQREKKRLEAIEGIRAKIELLPADEKERMELSARNIAELGQLISRGSALIDLLLREPKQDRDDNSVVLPTSQLNRRAL
jgi:DNA-binding transcriptional regulator GbsR (MarR family)